MKKITGLLCSIAMMFSLTACSGEKVNDDAIDAFEEAIVNLVKMESADYTIGFEQNSSDVNSNMTIGGTFINKNANPQFSMSVDADMDGQTQKDFMQIYITDNMMYMNLMDMAKQKQALDLTAATLGKSSDVKKGTLKKSGIKDYLKEATLKDDKITLVFDGEKVKKEIEDLSKEDTTGSLALVKKVNFNEIKVEMTVSDKMMKSTKVTFDMNVKVDGKTEKGKFVFDFSFKNVNKVKDIAFPDFTDYLEADASSSLLGM